MRGVLVLLHFWPAMLAELTLARQSSPYKEMQRVALAVPHLGKPSGSFDCILIISLYQHTHCRSIANQVTRCSYAFFFGVVGVRVGVVF